MLTCRLDLCTVVDQHGLLGDSFLTMGCTMVLFHCPWGLLSHILTIGSIR